MNRIARQHGFTLLELILAMTLVSVLSLSLYSSLRVAFKAKGSAENAIGPSQAVQGAMEMIRQDLESALPATGTQAGEFFGDAVLDGDQSSDTIQFYCLDRDLGSVDRIGSGAIRRMQFFIKTLEDGKTRALVRQVTENLLAAEEQVPIEEVLCRGVRSLAIEYFDGTVWTNTWDSTQQGDAIPTAVSITLEIGWPADAIQSPKIYRASRMFTLACGRAL